MTPGGRSVSKQCRLSTLIKLSGSWYAIIPVHLPISIDLLKIGERIAKLLGWKAPVKVEVTVMRKLGTQPGADGYLACHDVGVKASEPCRQDQS